MIISNMVALCLRDIEQQQEREKILLKTTSIKNKLPALRVTMVLESKKDS